MTSPLTIEGVGTGVCATCLTLALYDSLSVGNGHICRYEGGSALARRKLQETEHINSQTQGKEEFMIRKTWRRRDYTAVLTVRASGSGVLAIFFRDGRKARFIRF